MIHKELPAEHKLSISRLVMKEKRFAIMIRQVTG